MDIIEIEQTTINMWISHDIEVVAIIPLHDIDNFSVTFHLSEHNASFNCSATDFNSVVNALRNLTRVDISLPETNERCVKFLPHCNSFELIFECGRIILSAYVALRLLDFDAGVRYVMRREAIHHMPGQF